MISTKNTVKKQSISIPYKKCDKLALLYGIILGDGCLSRIKRSYFISIAGSIKDDLIFFEKVIVPILKDLINKEIPIRIRIKQRELHILFSHKVLFNKLKDKGFPIGKKGTKLKISEKFNKNDIKYIIQGYFATDGCLVLTKNPNKLYPRIEFSSISKGLLSQVLVYLKNLEMNGNIYISHKYSNKNWNTLYRLQFNGKNNLKIFEHKIGFINPKHKTKYESFLRIK
ncbi:hypothetical protein CEE44_00460 [Candidatus Woesearchaeota archaeon B3_Woes]|nr:MAG: hypothetical protein CEE44_00460 [Candidatus Woesearchaeota archaeon B3_Woes]